MLDRTLALLCSALLLGGCSATKPVAQSGSEAHKIASHMGLDVPDRTPEQHRAQMAEVLERRQTPGPDLVGAAIGGALGLGIGIANVGSANFPTPEDTDHLAAWVPVSLAKSQAEAAELLRNSYLQAAAKLNGIDWEKLVRQEVKFEAVFVTDRYPAYGYPDCPQIKIDRTTTYDQSCSAVAEVYIEDEANARATTNISDDLNDEDPVDNPVFIGPGQSYRLFILTRPLTGILQQPDGGDAGIIANMPDWIYRYVAPTPDAPAHILHRQKKLEFITP